MPERSEAADTARLLQTALDLAGAHDLARVADVVRKAVSSAPGQGATFTVDLPLR